MNLQRREEMKCFAVCVFLVLGFWPALLLAAPPHGASLSGNPSVGWFPMTGPEAGKFLVPGTPALTVGMQNTLLNCLEFGLELALTEEEENSLRECLMGEFLRFKGKLTENLSELAKVWELVETAPPEGRARLRLLVRESLQEELARNGEQGIGAILKDIQRRAGEVVSPGNPRIDQRSLDALREIVQLGIRLRDRRNVTWSAAERRLFDQTVLAGIPELSPEGRRWLANAEFHRAVIFRGWETTSREEKDTIRSLLIPIFAPPAAHGEPLGVSAAQIPLPPPNLFPLPHRLPWALRD